MHQTLMYLHDRMFVHKRDREWLMSIFVKKMIKSVARSNGTNIGSNKWGKALTFLYGASGPAMVRNDDLPESEHTKWLIDSFKRHLNQHVTTSGKTVLRIKLMLDYIRRQTLGMSVLEVFQFWQPQFNNDEDFLHDFGIKVGLRQNDCGHLSDRANTRVISGNSESHIGIRHICTDCFDRDAHLYTHNGNDRFLLTEFAVEARTDRGNLILDRRHPNVTWLERYQCFTDGSWSPYTNLIDQYHSSKSKGFDIIDSPWFRQHRRAFGLELEIQVRNENSSIAAGRIHDVVNPSGETGEYCYFERDGSIGEGFEIVTQPAGMDIHRQKLALFLNNPDIKRNMRSHEGGSCGLHIHVGRQYVTQAQIYRVQAFLNDVRNEGIVRKVSRRYSNNYARINHHMGKLSPEGKHSGERYEALNVTNSNTIEFRIFRGSLRYESVMAALEFVDALLNFCMPGQTSIRDFNSIGFRRFISAPEHRTDTEHLRPYLSINPSTDNESVAA